VIAEHMGDTFDLVGVHQGFESFLLLATVVTFTSLHFPEPFAQAKHAWSDYY